MIDVLRMAKSKVDGKKVWQIDKGKGNNYKFG